MQFISLLLVVYCLFVKLIINIKKATGNKIKQDPKEAKSFPKHILY